MTSAMQTTGILQNDLGLLAHCRRVAALANLIAHHLFLSSEDKDALHTAAILHHSDAGVRRKRAIDRLLSDICETGTLPWDPADPLPRSVRTILVAFETPGAGSESERRLGEILRLCDIFDQELEVQPLERRNSAEILDSLRPGIEEGLWGGELIAALEICLRPLPLGEPESWRIPELPAAVWRMLALTQRPNGCDADTLIRMKLAALDSMEPLMTSPRLSGLWLHSTEIAGIAEQLARRAGGIDPAEAWVGGLLHDVGRMVLLVVPLYDAARLQGLEQSGCPSVYAENLVLRTDHAELGSRIVEMWDLPEVFGAAIRLHHRPEETGDRFAHLLYLAEYLAGSEEDLPSQVRLQAALDGLGMTVEAAGDCLVSGPLSRLAASASSLEAVRP